MSAPNLLRTLAATAALGALLVSGLTAPAQAAPAETSPGKPLTVMTRNIYLGGDVMRPLVATAGLSGFEALLALGHENHALRQTVDDTDFPTRSKLLAAEIALVQPDAVGLQEVALWRSGPLQLEALGVANAETVDYDFLQILMADLAAAGARYTAVSIQVESDVEAPAFPGFPGGPGSSDQRLTMRDVLLVRDDPSVQVLEAGGASYQARLPISIVGIPLEFVRGYNYADLRVGGRTVRVVNTHLESASSDLALAQAVELVNGPGRTSSPVVLLCDCNSDPLDDSVKPTDPFGTPHSGPYDFLVSQGFVDQWLTHAPADQGWTSGLSETVDDATADGFDHRIDLVMVRGSAGSQPYADRGAVLGDEVGDRDPATGLWPSDHAGVALRLRGVR